MDAWAPSKYVMRGFLFIYFLWVAYIRLRETRPKINVNNDDDVEVDVLEVVIPFAHQERREAPLPLDRGGGKGGGVLRRAC